MFSITGEGFFVGDKYIADGMALCARLSDCGFNVTRLDTKVNPDRSKGEKRIRFKFECCTGADDEMV